MKKIATLIGFAVCTNVFSAPSQDLLWQDIQGSQEVVYKQKRVKSLSLDVDALNRRTLSLDESSLKQYLFSTNKISRARSSKVEPLSKKIDLPLPNGHYVRVSVIDSPVLSVELSASHPDIKTWRVVGVDDPLISGRIDITANGFHGMLVLADGETIFIDPDKATNVYHSLSKRENASHFNTDFNCKTHDKHSLLSNEELSNINRRKRSAKKLSGNKLEKLPAQELITYRLAVAGTAEFTSTLGGKTPAYSSMVTTINRVNEIYQRDFGVKLELVSNEALLYTNAATDPYTNNSISALVDENMENLNTTFGDANYDIGHVFADGANGGLAYVGVACLNQANVLRNSVSVTVNGIKGGGASSFHNPQGETFNIQFVAHEIGHQLGANHTFNGIKGYCGGNITNNTAVEPGSGSTIMSYSGSCGTDNLQTSPDAMFHWKSISQVSDYTRVDNIGSSCGARVSTGNQAPIVNAGNDKIIPVNTPFLLDGDEIAGGATYSWDQIDVGTASAVGVDKGDNAIIRTLSPNTNPDRYIPRLSDLFTGESTIGEMLPQTVRNLNFSFVVRDSNGEIANDEKLVSTENTGIAFKVLSQNIDETLFTGQTNNITWDVAGTTAPPINCSTVDIQLLRVDGVKNNLLMGTVNDGSEAIIIPDNTPLMNNARIMVACSTQPFFQISAGKIAIQQGVDNTPPVISITGLSTIDVIKGSNYIDQGATAVDNFDGTVSVTSVSTVDITLINTYTVIYTATDNAGNTSSKTRTVNIIPDTVAPIISLIGLSSIDIIKGSNYTDSGATAFDNLDGVVAVTNSGSVDTSTLGAYTITYSAVDIAGNISTQVTRTVNVVDDTVAPIISLSGANTVTLYKGQTYIDEGATATDNFDANITVVTSESVDINTVGTYIITYSAVDAAGNSATPVTKAVNIIADTVAPVITLIGSNTINIDQGADYSESGASAIDNLDSSASVIISGAVDTSTVGTYTITYTATDNAGNAATRERTVNVVKINGNALKAESSGGGSMGFLLLPVMLFSLRKRLLSSKK
jgi:hypothetical protein